MSGKCPKIYKSSIVSSENKCGVKMTPACTSQCELEPEMRMIPATSCDKMTPACVFVCCPEPPCGRRECTKKVPCPKCCAHAKNVGGIKSVCDKINSPPVKPKKDQKIKKSGCGCSRNK